MTEAFLCATCGVQYTPSEQPPERCTICDDERQFVLPSGQRWLTLEELRETHSNRIRPLEPGLTSIRPEPSFAMGHQALVVESRSGNVLWDCVALLDDATVAAVEALGGLSAIAISHPHFYDTMVEWSRAFGDVPLAGNPAHFQPDTLLRAQDGARAEGIAAVHRQGMVEDVKNAGHARKSCQNTLNGASTGCG